MTAVGWGSGGLGKHLQCAEYKSTWNLKVLKNIFRKLFLFLACHAIITAMKPPSSPPQTSRPPLVAAPVRTLPPEPESTQTDGDLLVKRITLEFDTLSRQLKLIARYVEENRAHIGLDRIQDVAGRCGVQPSAVIRFAKHFGFSGYTEMQKIFREGITRQIAPQRDYQMRIRSLIAAAQGQLSSADIAHEFIGGSITGMQELQRDLHGTIFDEAVDMLDQSSSTLPVVECRWLSAGCTLVECWVHTWVCSAVLVPAECACVHAFGKIRAGEGGRVLPGTGRGAA